MGNTNERTDDDEMNDTVFTERRREYVAVDGARINDILVSYDLTRAPEIRIVQCYYAIMSGVVFRVSSGENYLCQLVAGPKQTLRIEIRKYRETHAHHAAIQQSSRTYRELREFLRTLSGQFVYDKIGNNSHHFYDAICVFLSNNTELEKVNK